MVGVGTLQMVESRGLKRCSVLHLSNNSLTQSVTKVGIVMKVQAKQRRHTVIFCLGHRFTAVDLGLTCSGGIVFFLMCKWVK